MRIFELYMRLKECAAHIVFELRIAKKTAVYYSDNKPIKVYVIWGRW